MAQIVLADTANPRAASRAATSDITKSLPPRGSGAAEEAEEPARRRELRRALLGGDGGADSEQRADSLPLHPQRSLKKSQAAALVPPPTPIMPEDAEDAVNVTSGEESVSRETRDRENYGVHTRTASRTVDFPPTTTLALM